VSGAVGEALLAIGRFPASLAQDASSVAATQAATPDIAPILRWTTAADVEIRWRAAWALFRSRHPGASKELLRLSADPSAEVRFWAVRGLIPHKGTDAAPAAARLREAARDSDRRVRTEAIRTLGQHKDEASVKVLLEALNDKDSWISVSAAEGLGLQPDHTDLVVPRLSEAAGTSRPLALRLTARQALGRLGGPGQAALEMAPTEGLPQPAGRGGGGGGGGRSGRPAPQLLTLAEYRTIVEKWIVPDYNGAAKPRAIWDTPRGSIELELYPGDSPLGVEFFMRVHDSKEIIGTQFTRVVPNFVAQQQGIRNDVVLRDEVSRRGLTRGNLSWASAGLDTGRPGYTLGVTPQPHNEGNFTALGRIVAGMDVLERIELNDAITAARIVRTP
jgi:cyclophilin family peptidyl-prolyl cis-trans isomerase